MLMVSKLPVLDFPFGTRCEDLDFRASYAYFSALLRFWGVLCEDETARVVVYMRIQFAQTLRHFYGSSSDSAMLFFNPINSNIHYIHMDIDVVVQTMYTQSARGA